MKYKELSIQYTNKENRLKRIIRVFKRKEDNMYAVLTNLNVLYGTDLECAFKLPFGERVFDHVSKIKELQKNNFELIYLSENCSIEELKKLFPEEFL